MNYEQEVQALREELARLAAENEALKAPKKRAEPTISFKVSPKGALSVYGLQKFPVTLYLKQWVKLIGAIKDMETFIKGHEGQFATDKITKNNVVAIGTVTKQDAA